MKRIICIYLLIFLPLVSIGQIRRVITGITLGKTTKQEAISILKQKGIPFVFGNTGVYETIILKESSHFGGIEWFSTDYVLFDDIVFEINFTKWKCVGTSKQNIDLEWNNIALGLQRKYGSYKKKGNKDTIEYNDSSIKIS